jgi:hypothetical protein
MRNYEKKNSGHPNIHSVMYVQNYRDVAKIETSLLEGDVQSGSFTEKMTLDPDCGVNCMVACREPGVETKERSNVAGAKYNHGGCGSQSL